MKIISRAEWGARKPRGVEKVAPSKREAMMVHYTTGEELNVGRDGVDDWIRSIQRFHMDSNGWADIGYNYLIDRFGRVYEGRGWDVLGAHAGGANTPNIGVAFLGDDDPGQDVTDDARHAFVELYQWLRQKTGKALRRRGHRDVNSTKCPGDELYGWFTASKLVDPKAGSSGSTTSKPSKPSKPSSGYPSGSGSWPASWTLQKGSKGARVEKLQAALMAVFPLYASGIGSKAHPNRPDGSFGTKTDRAVREFQRRAGIDVDGKVGPQTTRRLQDFGIYLPTPKGWRR